MKRAWLRSILLAAVVAALGLFVYLKPGRDDGPQYTLSAIKPEGARTVRLERPGMPPIVLARKGEAWFLTSPLSARADARQVQRLLAVTTARSAARLAAIDLARFDLQRPAVRLTIDDQSFEFGMINSVSREQYVLTGGAVYGVSLGYLAALPAAPGELLDKQVLAQDELPERIELDDFSVGREEGKWVLKPPAGDMSQDDLQRWVDDWRHASALRVEPSRAGNPMAAVKMRLRGGTELSLEILAREPETLLMRSDEKLVYHLSRGAATRLLSPPQAKP